MVTRCGEYIFVYEKAHQYIEVKKVAFAAHSRQTECNLFVTFIAVSAQPHLSASSIWFSPFLLCCTSFQQIQQ